ncbi:MAG TPA: class I SAM-dependent rRNA methyltransferase [Burkholderiales bacterium]
MKPRKSIILKPGKDKSLLRRHPWIFSGAIAKVEGDPGPGDTVRVLGSDGGFLAQAAFSPQSQIRARAWSFEADETIDAGFFRRRLKAALDYRATLAIDSDALRLVHGECDGLPGLVVDRYAGQLVVQCSGTGVEAWREEIADALAELTGCANLYERSDADVRGLEGLDPRTGVLRGAAPAGPVVISEHGRKIEVDVPAGHKTGFYLDQRDNRQRVFEAAARMQGGEMLNCFCYTGAFSLAMLAGGAGSVLSIDSSGPALELARANVALNGLDATKAEWLEADVFKALRDLRNQGRTFDLIVLDPPKFAPTPASVERASRAYKDINLLGLKMLKPGGLLFTYSCSGGVSPDLFGKIVAGAATDAQVDARIEARLTAGADHPLLLSFPEGEYLKGLVLRKL